MNVIVMKPTFRALAKPDLLKKCVHGKTQNPNESLNQLIWKRCPKTLFVSSTIVQIATFVAILLYNDGNVLTTGESTVPTLLFKKYNEKHGREDP
ncbi:hypothetical protein ANN_26059 [Periplaneta americana]|uniref:Uncharacterized protein n=1 Tax=Periplaneta americana TaxID=6978 RepID=A0ABQ8S5B7_PERAM|nr:hypothetical protein ANN_26059 [Periplaneta americana]